MLWQGRVTRASGDRPVRNRRITAGYSTTLDPPTESGPNLTTRSYSCGAEEAEMKDWRERVADIFTKHGKIAAK